LGSGVRSTRHVGFAEGISTNVTVDGAGVGEADAVGKTADVEQAVAQRNIAKIARLMT